jgi:flagellar biosynthesis protein FliQ
MDQTIALDLARQGMEVAVMVSLPILAVSLFLGVLVSVFQAITSVQEMTLTFVPKLIGAGLVAIFLGNWMLLQLVTYTHLCFDHIAKVGRQ